MKREYAASTAKLKHGLIIAGLLAALGLWLLFLAGESIPDGELVGGINLAVAALIAGYSWYASRSPATALTVGAEGVWYREWGVTVPWREIADVFATGARLNPHIALQLENSAAFLGGLPEETAKRLQAGRYFKNGSLLLPNHCAEVAFSELLLTLQEGKRQFGEEGGRRER